VFLTVVAGEFFVTLDFGEVIQRPRKEGRQMLVFGQAPARGVSVKG